MDHDFFHEVSIVNWVKTNASGSRQPLFLAGLWWSWRHRNLMCLSQETWSLYRLHFHIQQTSETITTCFNSMQAQQSDTLVRWNNNDCNSIILNVDGSCLGETVRAGYGGLIRNSAGLYLSGFSGFMASTTDILLAELTAIYRGLLLAVQLGITDMVCYSDSLHSVKLLTEHASSFHVYAVLIQDIKDILSTTNFSIHHCLREGNQCADFMAKLGATSNTEYHHHATPPHALLPLIRTDAVGTLYPRV